VKHDDIGYGPGSESKYLASAELHRVAAEAHRAASKSQTDDLTANRNIDHTAAHIHHDALADMQEGNARESRREVENAYMANRSEASERSGKAYMMANQRGGEGKRLSAAAHFLTAQAVNPASHRAAYTAHINAFNFHTKATEKDGGPNGLHGEIARHHLAAGSSHLRASRHTPGGGKVDHGQITAMKVRGEVAKAHVEQHTRVVGGKVVQVSGYETHANAANAMSQNATKATSHAIGKGYEEHAAAAQLHKDAAEAHRTAAQHAPKPWMQRGHEQQATLHSHYADSHATEAAKTGPKVADEDKLPSYKDVAAKYPDHRHEVWNGGEMGDGQKYQTFKATNKNGEVVGSHTIAHHPDNMKGAEGHNKSLTIEGKSEVADKASRDTAVHARGESGYEEAHSKAAMLHEKAGEAHLQAHAEGKGSEHYHAASRHFGMSVDHAKESMGNQGTYDHASKIAGRLSEHADAHKLEDNYQSHDQHAAKHLLAIEAHGRAREAATKMGTTASANQYPANHHFLKADAHRTKIEHHRAEMAKGHDEISLRAKQAESASRATLAPDGGAKVHEEAAAAHRHAAAIQYDSEVRGQHEAKAAHHDEQAAAMKRRTPEHQSSVPSAKGPTDYTSANITAHDATEASELARNNTPDWQKAHDLTVGAHVMTSFKRDHAATAEAHTKAAEAHRKLHEATGNKYHGEAADHHEAAAKYHRDKAEASQTLHDRALAAAKSVKGRTGKQNLPYSETAHAASVRAEQTGNKDDHAQAARLHTGAEMSHDQAREDTGYKHKGHDEAWMAHRRAAAYHRAKAQ
jgi:hypothetical protein